MSNFPTPITKDYFESHIQKLNPQMTKSLFTEFHAQSGHGVKSNGVTRYPDGAWLMTDGPHWQLENNFYGTELDRAKNILAYYQLAEEVSIAEFREYKRQIIDICKHGVDPRRPILPNDSYLYEPKLEQLRNKAREMKAAKIAAQERANKVDPNYVSPEEQERRAAELARMQLVVDTFKQKILEMEV